MDSETASRRPLNYQPSPILSHPQNQKSTTPPTYVVPASAGSNHHPRRARLKPCICSAPRQGRKNVAGGANHRIEDSPAWRPGGAREGWVERTRLLPALSRPFGAPFLSGRISGGCTTGYLLMSLRDAKQIRSRDYMPPERHTAPLTATAPPSAKTRPYRSDTRSPPPNRARRGERAER